MTDSTPRPWASGIFDVLRAADIRQVGYVPDAGHSALISLCQEHPDMKTMVLTREDEGMGLAAGAWLGGERSVILMQSSGVGNCMNALTLTENCRFPLLMLVTMRGEWGEFNPWQLPMSRATQSVLEAMAVRVYRADRADDVVATVDAAARMAFDGDLATAVLLGQRVIGDKEWVR